MSRTIADLTELTGVATEFDGEVDVPVLQGLQRQGDIVIVPVEGLLYSATNEVPAEGHVLASGRGNAHTLFAEGAVRTSSSTTQHDLGVLSIAVPEGATAWVSHPEHGFLGVGEGTYEVRRQRTEAEQIEIRQD